MNKLTWTSKVKSSDLCMRCKCCLGCAELGHSSFVACASLSIKVNLLQRNAFLQSEENRYRLWSPMLQLPEDSGHNLLISGRPVSSALCPLWPGNDMVTLRYNVLWVHKSWEERGLPVPGQHHAETDSVFGFILAQNTSEVTSNLIFKTPHGRTYFLAYVTGITRWYKFCIYML